MAKLTAAERVKLPDRAFAYIDSRGKRRLPIVDAAHVRNALARFNQVDFEDEAARERSRARLLRAARRFKIVPVGFIDSQLRTERERRSRAAEPPAGFVTMVMTDIEGSTALLEELADDYGELLGAVREIHRAAADRFDGFVVEARADEFFVAFESPAAAVEMAVATQRRLLDRCWPGGAIVRVRMGLHAGYPTVREANYIGMAVHTASRIADAAHGGQIVVSDDAKTALTDMTPDGIGFKRLGRHRLRGIPDEHALYQVTADGLERRFPALRV